MQLGFLKIILSTINLKNEYLKNIHHLSPPIIIIIIMLIIIIIMTVIIITIVMVIKNLQFCFSHSLSAFSLS